MLDPIRPTIERLLRPAIRAVNLANGNTDFANRMKDDEFLHYETVDCALSQLRRAVLTAGSTSNSEAPAKGITALMTGRQAAECIGVTESTLSNWRRTVPKWARGNAVMFGFLLERDGLLYRRHSVLKLAKWWRRALEAGEQTPVDCP